MYEHIDNGKIKIGKLIDTIEMNVSQFEFNKTNEISIKNVHIHVYEVTFDSIPLSDVELLQYPSAICETHVIYLKFLKLLIFQQY